MKNYLVLLMLAIPFFISCNGANDFSYSPAPETENMGFAEEKTASREDERYDQATDGTAQSADLPEITRKIIKTADYRIRVNSVEESTTRIENLVTEYGGYITAQEVNSSSYELNGTISIRVPAEKFDALLEALGGEAEFTNYKRVEARDVTEEYVDIETRLATKKEVRDRYVDILRNKAKTVEEVLLAEEQIRVIQEEIESREGRLRFLKDRVSMSTINLNIYQLIEYQEEPSVYKRNFWGELKDNIVDGGALIRDIFLGLVSIWPLILLLLLFLWKGKWMWRKIRK
ncbi:MAG: DUF4349 domain-containing protein [Saprospiraceae bacterium]|nr:DUF4349 domain-containing protein [Saprospiraceae bacterium]